MPRAKKAGARYDCGKLRPAVTQNQVSRGRDRLIREGRNPWLATQIGRLATDPGPEGPPLISPSQCEAGLAFASLFNAMAREMGLPARAPRSCAFDSGGMGCPSLEPTTRTDAVLAAYMAARDRLEAVGALDIVVAVCVDDQAPPRWERARLVKGLKALMG